MKSLISIFICILTIMTSTSEVLGGSDLECGKEYRFVTVDGVKYRGHLIRNDGGLLSLRMGHRGTAIPLSSVESAYHVKRHAATGAVLGAAIGTGVGLFVAKKWDEQQTHDGWFEWHIEEMTMITVGVAAVGAVVGAILGNVPSYHAVELELVPVCSSPSGEEMPVKLGLAYRF